MQKSSSQSVIYIQKKTTFVSPLSPSGGIGRRVGLKTDEVKLVPVRSRPRVRKIELIIKLLTLFFILIAIINRLNSKLTYLLTKNYVFLIFSLIG